MKDLDLVVVGRAAIDLYAEQVGRPLEDAETFARYMGGCAGNIAVGTSRLGLKVAMLTRVGDEPLGTFVTRFLAQEGVDVTHVRRDPQHLTGLVVLGIRPPRDFPILFFRENCADIHLEPGDVPAALLARARALVITGTGLSKEPSRSAHRRLLELARQNDVKVVLDLDFRPTLWESRQAAAAALAEVVAVADLIVGTEEEYQVAGGVEDTEPALAKVRAAARGVVVIKRGERGCDVLPDRTATRIHGPPHPVEVLNVLGAGDGFISGFLYGWLHGWDWSRTARTANAVGAIVVTRHGCAPAMPRLPEVEQFLGERGAG